MRRFDKLNNIRKANLLSEQRYLQSKGLLNENINESEEFVHMQKNVDLINESEYNELLKENILQQIKDKIKTTWANVVTEPNAAHRAVKFLKFFFFSNKNQASIEAFKNIINTLTNGNPNRTEPFTPEEWEGIKTKYLSSGEQIKKNFPELKTAIDRGFEIIEEELKIAKQEKPKWLPQFAFKSFFNLADKIVIKMKNGEKEIYELIQHILTGKYGPYKAGAQSAMGAYEGPNLDFIEKYQELIPKQQNNEKI